jgi:hypothetical protein
MRELAALLGVGCPDHGNGVGNIHRAGFAAHGQNGVDPSAKRLGTLRVGIALVRESADSGAPQRVRTADVATAASPQ